MARGRQKGVTSLRDTVNDNEIVRLGEVRNEPIYPLQDGNYGIAGEYRDYSLVKKRIAYRTGTEEDGINKDKVIEYTTWEDVPCYSSELSNLFKAYAKILSLSEFKSKKLNGEISELVNIQKNTYAMIDKALSGFDAALATEHENLLNLVDQKMQLEEDIKQLREQINKYTAIDKEIDRMFNTIKEKTTIIVNRDKHKNHRIPKED